jgi:hypothetical protein
MPGDASVLAYTVLAESASRAQRPVWSRSGPRCSVPMLPRRPCQGLGRLRLPRHSSCLNAQHSVFSSWDAPCLRISTAAQLCCAPPHASTQFRVLQPCCRTKHPCWTLIQLVRADNEFGAGAQHTSDMMVHTEVSKAAQGPLGWLASPTLRQQAQVHKPCNKGLAVQQRPGRSGRQSLACSAQASLC